MLKSEPEACGPKDYGARNALWASWR